MSEVIISPNMNLPVPVVGSEPGPDWANDNNACLGIIDSHDHASGSGVQITPDGLNINSNLPFNDYGATGLSLLSFSAQSSITTIDSLYVKGVDLYYRDGSSNEVRITTGGAVNATSSGISNGTATASFVSTVLVVNSASNTPANIQCGSVLLGNNVAGSHFLTLQPPNAMAADYSLTLPSVPAAQQFVSIDTSGNISGYVNVSGGITSTNLASNSVTTAKITDANVTAAKLASNSVTTAKIVDAAVTSAKIQSNVNLDGNLCTAATRALMVANTNAASMCSYIRGEVSSGGTAASGEGFSVSKLSTGLYRVSYTGAYPSAPVVTATPNSSLAFTASVASVTATTFDVYTFDGAGSGADVGFYFIVMGPIA